MERPHRDDLPRLVANTRNLRQQLEQLHANVKATVAERLPPSKRVEAGGMVIRGK